MTISVVDIFAGPGGLSEGFSSLLSPKTGRALFRIAVSAEMEVNASRTLRLRAFLRQFPQGEAPASYYNYVTGRSTQPWTEPTKAQWKAAEAEALQLTLGKPDDDQRLSERIAIVAKSSKPWVLIGGPPCQAYSLVGRARNAGVSGYQPEADSRHFLYEHYLRIINQYRPTAFIMENVKGILSSKIGGDEIFPRIVRDLSRSGKPGSRYNIIPLVHDRATGELRNHSDEAFIVRSEDIGIPQARHRVILFGLSDELPLPSKFIERGLLKKATVRDAISRLPKIRSSLTDSVDSDWPKVARTILLKAAKEAKSGHRDVEALLRSYASEVTLSVDPGSGGLRVPRSRGESSSMPTHLREWFGDRKLEVHLNHEARGHMTPDLVRYAFASAFAVANGRSPRGHLDFPDSLAPDHANWGSGKFLDRFKVQTWDLPSSTVTSHLSKDGHYFIHPDASQLRSLSVREAARLQTFPDNYFFEGPRGAQFRQVGNAVPPLLARQIAEVVHAAITR